MNINRHNYEEFFLLYTDNELSDAERIAVESFVQQNADLAQELALFQQAALVPDEQIIFGNKEALYKNEQAISIDNYEEYFLLYIDDELSPQEKNEVEKFVLQHPQLQNDFTLLQQTKLPQQRIEFKNKSFLYRIEKERRIVPMAWLRVAVAAAVIGLAISWWMISANDTGTPPSTKVAVNNKTNEPPAKQINIAPAIQGTAPVATKKNEVKQNLALEKVNELSKKPIQQAVAKNVEDQKNKEVIQATNNLPVPENAIAENTKKLNEETSNQQSKTINVNPQDRIWASNTVTKSTNANDQLIQPAVYKEMNNEQEEEDKTIYIAGAEINKNKLRSLFKKAAGFFDKRFKKTANDEKTIQVANFEIKGK